MEDKGRKTIPANMSKYFSQIGQKGGNSLKAKYGPEYFSRISKKGWKYGGNKKRLAKRSR